MTAGVWRPNPPASAEAIAMLKQGAPIALPASYLDQLSSSDGGEGDLGLPPGWVAFWPAAEVLSANAGYSIPEFLPGFFGFGSSGGGDLLAFDVRGATPFPVVSVPFVPMDVDEVVEIAASFEEFRLLIGQRLT